MREALSNAVYGAIKSHISAHGTALVDSSIGSLHKRLMGAIVAVLSEPNETCCRCERVVTSSAGTICDLCFSNAFGYIAGKKIGTGNQATQEHASSVPSEAQKLNSQPDDPSLRVVPRAPQDQHEENDQARSVEPQLRAGESDPRGVDRGDSIRDVLAEKWRAAAEQQMAWSRESNAKGDGANSHTERARARIYRECADDLLGYRGHPATTQPLGSAQSAAQKENSSIISLPSASTSRLRVTCRRWRYGRT